MKKIIRLTESDLTRIVKRVIMEQSTTNPELTNHLTNVKGKYLGNLRGNDGQPIGKSMKILNVRTPDNKTWEILAKGARSVYDQKTGQTSEGEGFMRFNCSTGKVLWNHTIDFSPGTDVTAYMTNEYNSGSSGIPNWRQYCPKFPVTPVKK